MLKWIAFLALFVFVRSERAEEPPPPLEEQLKPEDLPQLTPLVTSTQQCNISKVDVIFVVDQSGSIGSSNFRTVRTFLSNVAGQLSFPDARMGIVEFNTYASNWFSLNSYSSISSVQSAISRMPYRGGGTDIAAGMNYATNYAFTSSRGDRSDVDDVMVVMTDGQDSSNVRAAYNAAANKKIKVIAIGVGSGVSKTELVEIVGGDQSLVFTVTNFASLDSIVSTICQEVATACDSDPCINGGSCTEINSGSDFTCSCTADYTGPLCETLVDPCNSSPCHHGATCSANGLSYVCTCTPDYTGPQCDTFLDPCSTNPCLSGSTCERVNATTYNCLCRIGFTGQNCDTEICQNGGTFTCDCPYGYYGELCENRRDFCNETEYVFNGTYVNVNICGIHGACTNTPEGPVCNCDLGWAGKYCREDVNDCTSAPCQNGGTCINLWGPGYVCNCDKLHTGTNCENDIDMCTRDIIHAVTGQVVQVPICGDHGTCVQNEDGTVCLCEQGWTGPFCDTEIPVNCQYKGHTYLHNTTWTDHCDDCNCQFGVVQCATSNWCPQQCAIYETPQTLAKNITVGCPEYQNCVPEDWNCAHETPSCDFPAGWCFPVGYVIIDPRLPPNFHPPKNV